MAVSQHSEDEGSCGLQWGPRKIPSSRTLVSTAAPGEPLGVVGGVAQDEAAHEVESCLVALPPAPALRVLPVLLLPFSPPYLEQSPALPPSGMSPRISTHI